MDQISESIFSKKKNFVNLGTYFIYFLFVFKIYLLTIVVLELIKLVQSILYNTKFKKIQFNYILKNLCISNIKKVMNFLKFRINNFLNLDVMLL